MNRSGKLKANNDSLIDALINDSRYEINNNGTITRNGKLLGRKDKEGYVEIYYKGKRLKAHRIVYRKFNGNLEKDLVVNHKNCLTADNSSNNLDMCTQQRNIEYKRRKKLRTGK